MKKIIALVLALFVAAAAFAENVFVFRNSTGANIVVEVDGKCQALNDGMLHVATSRSKKPVTCSIHFDCELDETGFTINGGTWKGLELKISGEYEFTAPGKIDVHPFNVQENVR